mgnify:CR=1 FL=1
MSTVPNTVPAGVASYVQFVPSYEIGASDSTLRFVSSHQYRPGTPGPEKSDYYYSILHSQINCVPLYAETAHPMSC